MKYLKFFEELTGKYKEETDIIYKDKDLICLIPKSQMTSRVLSRKTNWCQQSKLGFDVWSKKGDNLLVRFLFKDGKKIRFTYEHLKDYNMTQYHWANESGYHVFQEKGENPFNIKPRKEKISTIEQDILNYINKIPEACKNKVLEYINKYRKESYPYIYRGDDYKSIKVDRMLKPFLDIEKKYENDIKKLDKKGIYIKLYRPDFEKKVSKDYNKYGIEVLNYDLNQDDENEGEYKEYDTIEEFERGVKSTIYKYKS